MFSARNPRRILKRWSAIGRIWVLTGIVGAFLAVPGLVAAGTPVYPSDNERLGFGVTQGIENYDVSPLHAGWYVNWGTAPTAAHPAGLEFAQIIRVTNAGYSPSGSKLLSIIDRSPGALWLIGNEPDCPYQDNTLPDNYARIYHDVYATIKGRDSTAQIAIGGIVQATPLRMQWVDAVWSAYQTSYGQAMPVDVWNVHAFVLREVRPGHGVECRPAGATESGEWGAGIPPGLSANCGQWVAMDGLDRMDLFEQQIVRFRTWMRDHGQQNKPLIVSEYGILFNAELGYGYERVRDYMLETFDYFLGARDTSLGYAADDYHLVQRWAWYSLDDDNFVWGTTYSALMNPKTRALYPLGDDFAHYAAVRVTPYVDLQPVQLRASTSAAIPYGNTGLVRLDLDVRNQGNTASAAAQVRFWDGVPDQGGVLLGTASLPAVPSRHDGSATASLNWSAAAAGVYQITVQIDPTNQVRESREDNNLLAVTLDFGTVNLTAGKANWGVESGPLRTGEPTQIRLAPVTTMMSQPTAPTAGLSITPPAYRATWYDGDPAAGGQIIASQTLPAPSHFGACQAVPAQAWSPVITGSRPLWLVVGLDNGAPETTLSDNQSTTTVSATTDLSLIQAQQEGVPLAKVGAPADVRLSFQVANLGTLAPSQPIQVGLWAGTKRVGPALAHVGLSSAGAWTEPLLWPALEIGGHPFLAMIDPDNVTVESNEDNNEFLGTAVVAHYRYYVPVTLGAKGRAIYLAMPVTPAACWR